jgi:hypothetical protein
MDTKPTVASGVTWQLVSGPSRGVVVSLWKQKRSVLEESLRSEKSAISKSCSN